MKKFTFCTLVYIIIIICAYCITAYGQSTKTFSKSLDLSNLTKLNSKLSGTVEYIPTNSKRIVVETTVSVQHGTRDEAIMQYIAAKGLATIETTIDENADTISINAPMLMPIVVNNKAAVITTSYKVYVPKTMNLL